MAEFANPFTGDTPGRRLTRNELIRAIRLNIAAEQEAAFLYTAHADATDNSLARKVLLDVADEERVHIGEFQRLLQILTGDEDDFLAQGRGEVDELAAATAVEAGGGTSGQAVESDGASGEAPTVGSLRK